MQDKEISFEGVLERYAGVPVLITGASGFIGRWVARLLTRAGADLYLPARDCAAAKATFRSYEIDGSIFKIDLLDTDRVQRFIEEVSPDIIFNLAGYGVDRSERSESLAFAINAELPEKICEAVAETTPSVEWNGLRVVHAGTAMEYGTVTGDLAETSPTSPTTLYGRSKLAGTEAVSSICRKTSLAAMTARLFAVYGPGESDERLFPTLVSSAERRSGHIELTAGLHKRDFTYVEDVAEALLRLGVAECRAGEVVNVATGTLTSIRSFVETAASILGITEDRLCFGALGTRPEEMQHDPVNIGRLRELTGWNPLTNLSDGQLKTLTFARMHETVRANALAREAVCELF